MSDKGLYIIQIEHPAPWKYQSNYDGKSNAAIIDNDGKVIVAEDKVSQTVMDIVWTFYCDLMPKE